MGKRRLIMDLLSNLVAFLVFSNIFTFVFTMLHRYEPWPYLLLALPFFALLPLRLKIKKMRYFLVAHFALFTLVFAAVSDVWIFGPLLGFAIASVAYSFYRKGKGEWSLQGSSAAWVIAILAALSMLYGAFLPQLEGIPVLLNISSLVVLAAVVLYIHLDNMQFSLKLLGEGDQHKKTVGASRVSNLLISVFLTIIVIFGAISVLFPSDAAALVLLRLVGNILLLPFLLVTNIMRMFIYTPENGYEALPFFEAIWEGYYEMPQTMIEPEPDVAAHVTGVIMGIVSMVLVAAIVIGLTILLFYKLYKAFGRKNEEGKQSLMPEDIVGKLKFVLGDFKDLLPRFRLGAKHPIRRAYIKKVNSHVKRGFILRPHYTPEKIADKIRPTENIDELTRKYEEVRYGRT